MDTQRVLVVDDEEKTRHALTDDGPDVVKVPTGDRALDVFGKQRLDSLATDRSMSGLEFAKQVKRTDSSAPIATLAGWADELDDQKVSATGVGCLLAGPCSNKAPSAQVQEAVGKPVEA